jgi:hypothetical protein
MTPRAATLILVKVPVVDTAKYSERNADEEHKEKEDEDDPYPYRPSSATVAVGVYLLRLRLSTVAIWWKALLALCIGWLVELDVFEFLVWNIMGWGWLGWFPIVFLVKRLYIVSGGIERELDIVQHSFHCHT